MMEFIESIKDNSSKSYDMRYWSSKTSSAATYMALKKLGKKIKISYEKNKTIRRVQHERN